MKPLFVSIPYSPWSRRAWIALKRMEVDVDKRVYTPTISEPWLRWRTRRPRGPITVPVLLWDGPALLDGLDIVRWGSERAEEPLITPANDGAVEVWNTRSSRALEAGRLLTTQAVLADEKALSASLPPPIRRLGPLGRAIGRHASRQLLDKYAIGGDAAAWERTLETYCEELRSDLGGRPFLLDGPSYADITAAIGLSFVLPDPRAPIAPAALKCWTRVDLAEAYADLLAWRDGVLA